MWMMGNVQARFNSTAFVNLFVILFVQDELSPSDEEEAESQSVLIGDKEVKVRGQGQRSKTMIKLREVIFLMRFMCLFCIYS